MNKNPNFVLHLVGLGVALSLLADATLYVVLPTQYAQAGILATQVGLMLSANRAIRIFLNTPLGVLIENMPRRRMLIPSMFIGAAASLLYAVPGFWSLLIGRLLWGAGWAGLYLGATTAILDLASDENRGYLIGRLQMWFFVGVGISSLFGGIVFDLIGYAATFYLTALIIGFMGVLWLLFLPETRPDQPTPVITTETTPDERPRAPLAPRTPVIVAILIYGLNWIIFIGMAVSVLPLLIQERLGEQIALFGLLVLPLVTFTGVLSAFNTLISIISSPLSGWLTDRSGSRWGVVAVMVIVGVGALVLAAYGGAVVVILATMINAIITSVLTTQLTAIVGDYARGGGSQGRWLGVMNTAGDIGGTVGPFFAFLLLPSIQLEGLFLLAAGLFLLALPWALRYAWFSKTQAIMRAT